MPGEGFFCDRSEHDEDEADGGESGEHPGSDAKASGNFGDSQEDGEALLIPMSLARSAAFFTWLEPLVTKTRPTMRRMSSRARSVKLAS